MRCVPAVVSLLVSAVLTCAVLAVVQVFAAPPGPSAAAPAAAAAPTPAGTPSSADEAAARHARRAACVDQARAKKLLGAQKRAYIKSCIAPS